MGHARAAQDRPHRLSLARAAIHRSGRPVFFYVPAGDVRAFAETHFATPVRRCRRAVRATAAIAAASTPSSACHGLERPSARSPRRPSCAARTPALSSSRPNRPGLLAASQGLSALFADDHAMLRSRHARCTTGSTRGAGSATRKRTAGSPARCETQRLSRRLGHDARRARRRGRRRSATGFGSASSASAGPRARSRSCIASSSTSAAGSPSRVSCTRSTTAWCCRARRRSSSPPTSAGSCIARGAASSQAGCSCCRRSCILVALSWLYMAYGHVPAVAGVALMA